MVNILLDRIWQMKCDITKGEKMGTRKSKILKELEPEEIEGYTETQIQYFMSLGYKPYLNAKHQVKWLTDAQRSMRGTVGSSIPLSRRIFPKNIYNEGKRGNPHFNLWRFIRYYWLTVLVSAITTVIVIVLLRFPGLIF